VEYYSTIRRFSFDFAAPRFSFSIFAANKLISCHEESLSFILFDCDVGGWM
jgi:hypothetical protein